MMLQSKLDVLTTTALQSDTICGELRSTKKREGAGSVIFGPALLLLLAACGGGGGGGGVVVANPEPTDTNDTTPDDARVKVSAGPADANGVSRQETANTKIDVIAETLQDVSLSAIYKSGNDDADITIEFVDDQNQLRHVFTITNGANGALDITVDNKPLSIQFGADGDIKNDDLSGANNFTSFLDGGEGNDALNGGENEHNVFGFSGKNFGQDTIVNPNPKSNSHFNDGDIISFIEYVLRRPTDDVREREGVEFITPSFDGENLKLSTPSANGSSVTVEHAAYLDIGIRSSHGNVENFIYALSNPDESQELRGTFLPDIIFGREGVDNIKSLGGNDEIKAGEGGDIIDAGEGDDYIEGQEGADKIEGGEGNDTIAFNGRDVSNYISVDLANNEGSQGEAAGDSYMNIENIIGSNLGDILFGDDGDNVIEGWSGFFQGLGDIINGKGGNDTASYAGSNAGVNVNLDSPTTSVHYGEVYLGGHTGGHAEGDRLRNIENLIGSGFNDTLTGDSGVNVLEGGNGSDILWGNGGNDVFVANINGGDFDLIRDFNAGDKLRIDVDDPSSITDLASLYAALNLTVSNDQDYYQDGVNDLYLTFAGQGGAADYRIVLDDNGNFDLSFTDFEII